MIKPTYLFIINPVSGKGKAIEKITIIEEIMDKSGCNYKIQLTEGVGHAKTLAEEAVEDVIVAVGGDGTIGEIANGLVDRNKSFGLIPSGTGNDFIRSLDIPSDILGAMETILAGKTRELNLGMVQNLYFVNVASVGLDAHIVDKAIAIKKHFTGTKAYIVALIRGLITYRTIHLELSIDDGIHKSINTMLMAFCNGRFYGGGMKIAPMADFDDDLLDLCIIRKLSKLKLFVLFPSIFQGKHLRFKEVEAIRGKKIIIHTNDRLKVNIDGEVAIIQGNKNEGIVFQISDKKIRVLVK